MALVASEPWPPAVEVALIQISPPVNAIGPEMICLIGQRPVPASVPIVSKRRVMVDCDTRVVVSYMGKNYFRNFLAPNPGICEVPGENLLGEIIFDSDHIYPVLNDLEVSRNVI